ncbi:iron-siderophore ABC transporter substrate-binding protein [Pseudonocardia sp. RS11V-5]|uniref:iron-siderophore ABC transporter substrate-binding protein n=1 Tax=Pseudonocardia terrae TaxID=2905831 RepID=UPI001E57D087|nr:iron-siderophore ABC transporter substrate-binding protein [Pseudonocardia terrae]MCE3555877.1 iron-siderophore ABC transporter substrate-binding protein [Pseudonocardia terrae]
MFGDRRPGRLLSLVGLLLAGVLVLAGCGGSGGQQSGSGSTAPSGAAGAFPATVTHKFGTTTVPAAPQRVVSLGYTDQDAILALGVVPVAIREFTGNKPSATWDWAQDELQGQQPQVLPVGDVGTEAIAALRPDLIIGISAGLTQEQYDTYSKIAPTIAQPAGFVDYGTPWQDATRLTGRALGTPAAAEKLISDLEARFAQAKEQYPALQGKTVAAVRPSSNDSASFFAWSSQDLRGRFFESIGMKIPDEINDLAGNEFYATISTEELSTLNSVDALALITASDAETRQFESLPGYARLKPVSEGHAFTPDTEQSAALSFSSVLSLPALLDTLPGDLNAKLG